VWGFHSRRNLVLRLKTCTRGLNYDQQSHSTPTPTEQDPRWTHVKMRDKSADGAFGTRSRPPAFFCRPSCASRTANPKNVRFHGSPAAARAVGFRPCKRCKPEGASLDAQNAALVAKACKLIESRGEPMSLQDLAGAVELSPHYFHRLFKAKVGLTPKEYASAHQASRVRRISKAGRRLRRRSTTRAKLQRPLL